MSQTSNTSQVAPHGNTKNGSSERSIFRRAALERLSSPEQLDYLMSITSPAGWLAISAIGIILFLIVLWGFLGRVPDKVSGSGILIRGGAVYDVAAANDGFVTQVLVKPGDEVNSGQVVDTMSQSDLDLKIKKTALEHKGLQTKDADMTQRETKSYAAAIADYEKEGKALEDAEKSYRVQIQADQTEFDNQSSLLQKGLTTPSNVTKPPDNIYAVQLQLANTQVPER